MEVNFCTECGVAIPAHVKQCGPHRKTAKDKAKTQKNQSKVPDKAEKVDKEGGRHDRWAALHAGRTCTTLVKLTKLDDAYQVDRHGLPDATVLNDMVGCCGRLKIKEAVGKYNEPLGICFNIVNYTPGVGKGSSNRSPMFNEHLTNKGSSSVCFENTFLPLPVSNGHVLVHQSLAPCLLCCEAYRVWAMNGAMTIVVAYDKGYDGSQSAGFFIFSSTGNGFAL